MKLLEAAIDKIAKLNWVYDEYGFEGGAWIAPISLDQAKVLEEHFHFSSSDPNINTVDDLLEYGHEDVGLETGSKGNYVSIFTDEGRLSVVVSSELMKETIEKYL